MLFRYLSELIQTKLEQWRKVTPAQQASQPDIKTVAPAENPQVTQAPTQAPNVPSTAFQASKGNITVYGGDAIVNAANTALMPGGGVCGAIFGATDFDKLEEACMNLGGCPTGGAKVTPSFGMAAPWIVHAVGPIWEGGMRDEPALLAGAYRSSLEAAHGVGARSIAFPAISTGIYGYPLDLATKVAVETIRAYTEENPTHFDAIDVLCFDDKTLNCYLDTMAGNNAKQPTIEVTGSFGL